MVRLTFSNKDFRHWNWGKQGKDMLHIFVSYQHGDLDFTENVISRIEKKGFNTWTDHKIAAGEEWRNMIDIAIKNSFALIVIITPESKASEYITYEWAFAWGIGIKVIPIMLRPTSLHPRLEALQYLDFTNPKLRPWDKLTEEIKAASFSPLAHSINVPLNSSPAIRLAVQALDSANPSDRKNALRTLEQTSGEEAQKILIEALQHPIADVRKGAVEILGKIKHFNSMALLEKALLDNNEDVRISAASVLTERGDNRGKSILHQSLKNSTDWKMRQYLIKILGDLHDNSALPLLRKALSDTNDDVRGAAALSLGKIKDPSSVSLLCKALFYGEKVGISASWALGEIGSNKAVSSLEEVLMDNKTFYSDIQIAAAEALEKIGDDSAKSVLYNIASRNNNPDVRRIATRATRD